MNVRLNHTGAVVHACRRTRPTFAWETACGRLFSWLGSLDVEDEVDCMACVAAAEPTIVVVTTRTDTVE
jgi:hypothetical protein